MYMYLGHITSRSWFCCWATVRKFCRSESGSCISF